MKIALLGLINDRNLGDRIIADSCDFLVREVVGSSTETTLTELLLKHNFPERRCLKILRWMGYYRLAFRLAVGFNKRKFIKHFRGSELVIIVGGGIIKYKYQGLVPYLCGAISAAQKLKIKVVFNGVGVEGYDNNNYLCQELKRYLNSPCVGAITTRDDLTTLQEKYLTKNIYTAIVADSAVHCAEAYGITKIKNTQTIGVGIVRGGIFKENGIDLSTNSVVELYYNIITELENNNTPYELFTNGLPKDSEIIPALEERLAKKIELYEPCSPEELITKIASYRGIIAARLHACIVSYSLGVPFVGLKWNNKLSFFAQNIGYGERMISPEEFDATHICNTLERAITEGYNNTSKEAFKNTTKESLKDILLI